MFYNNDCVEIKECLACGHDELVPVLDLNKQPLANSYKLNKEEVQQEFPLAINRCKKCYHVQLTHAVNPDLMFKEYLYVSGTSQTMRDYFAWFSKYTTEYYQLVNHSSAKSVFDIGCNDGSQLDQYKKQSNILTFGIDPAENLYHFSVENHAVYLGYFDKEFIKNKREQDYDIIIAQNVFAHNYDPLSFLKTIKEVCNDRSLVFIQTSQADMILNNEFDTIYHEHISFYNINSMNELCKRAGLNLIDVVKSPLHGNSYIFVISKALKRDANVINLIEMERKAGLLWDNTYVSYAINCNEVVSTLAEAVESFRKDHKIIGYGAAAKGMTLLNYSKIYMDYIVDDNKLKQGRYTPGSSIPIVSSDELLKLSDEDSVMFIPLAWNFYDEIKKNILKKRNNSNDVFVRYFPMLEIDD